MQEVPEIAIWDVALGLASAALLVIALFYLARSRPAHLLAVSERGPQGAEPELFESLFLHDTGRGLSFIASLFLHMLAVALVPWLQLVYLPALLPDFGPKELVLLEYRIPDVALIAPTDLPDEQKEEEPLQEEAAAAGKAPAAEGSGSKRPVDAGAATASEEQLSRVEIKPPPAKPRDVFKPSFRVVLPEIAPADPALKDLILQPELDLEFPPDHAPQLPPVLAWTPNPRELENAVLVEPGYREPDQPERWELPEAEPQLLRPNEQTTLAELQISPSEILVEKPALPIVPAVVTPLQGVIPPKEPLPQLPSLSEGEVSTTLVALNREPNPLTPSFLLEMGLRLGMLDSGLEMAENEISIEGEETDEPAEVTSEDRELAESSKPDGSVGESSPDETRADAASSEVEGEILVAGAGVGPPGNQGVADGEGEAEGIALVRGEGVGRGVSSGGEAGDLTTGLGNASPTTEPGQPGASQGTVGGVPGGSDRDGPLTASGFGPGSDRGGESGTGKSSFRPLPRKHYGIILVSNSQSVLGDVKGILRGNPIYTVHFEVPEAPRKWTLQFCIPESESNRLDVSNGVIRIRPRKKVAPPFPQKKNPLRLSPAGDVEADRPSRVVVYATVDEAGELGNLRVVRGADPKTDHTILANLQSWEFLPAFRGEEPILVEALFGIPLP